LKPTTLAAAATTAALAAAGAYAVGSQQADGSAQAAGATRSAAGVQAAYAASTQAGRGPGRDLSSAADALGVSQSALRTALQELHAEQDPKPGRADLAAALAKALGKTEAQVTAAFRAIREDGAGRRGPGRDLARALASELDVSAERVRTALQEAHEAAHAARRQELVAALAEELGIEAARVSAALEELRPPARDGFPRERTDLTEALAQELNIEEERVDEAFDALREAREAEFEQRRQAFADRLADKLNIPRARVRELIADRGLLVGPGFGGRRGGPGGPGFAHP